MEPIVPTINPNINGEFVKKVHNNQHNNCIDIVLNVLLKNDVERFQKMCLISLLNPQIKTVPLIHFLS